MGYDQLAAIGNNTDRGRHLQRRHTHLVAHRYRGERTRTEIRRVPDDTGARAAEVGAEHLSEAEAVDADTEEIRAELLTDLDRTDVARLGNDVDERQQPVMMRVGDLARAERDVAGVAVDEIGGADHAFFDRGGSGDDLERGAGLVGVLDRTIPASDEVGAAELVRVEGRPVRQREDLAGLRLHDDGRAARRLVFLDADPELAVGDELQVLVDRQLEAGAGGREVLLARRHRLSPAVALQEDLSFLAADLVVERGFETGEAEIVDPDVSKQVRSELVVRVVTPALLVEEHPGKIQRLDATCFLGCDLPGEEGELALGAEPLGHLLPLLTGARLE